MLSGSSVLSSNEVNFVSEAIIEQGKDFMPDKQLGVSMASRNTSFEDRPIDVSCLSKDDLILKNLGRSASARDDLTIKK